jgi:hypothetical protein
LLPAIFDRHPLLHKLDQLIQTSRLNRRREDIVFDASATEATPALLIVIVKDLSERVAKFGVVDVINVATGANDKSWYRGVVEPVLGEGC